MSIVRETNSIFIDNFKGDGYLTKKDIDKYIKKKKTLEKPAEPRAPTIRKKTKKRRPSISYKDYITNKVFKLWLHDNINELEDSFSIMYNIFISNNAIMSRPYNEIFQNYCRKFFKSDKKNIFKYYKFDYY